MAEKNGYVRWCTLVPILISIVVAVAGIAAFLVGQHGDVEAHAGAVHKDQFVEFAKRVEQAGDAQRADQARLRTVLDDIQRDIKEIRREMKR